MEKNNTGSSTEASAKAGKYLKYAIGEIVLVVIGILIAVSMNNWNENRLENKRADAFVKKLKVQIENNIARVDNQIQKFESTYNASKRLISIIGSSDIAHVDIKIDSLVFVTTYDYHLNLDMNTIIEARENGDLALISSDTLRQSIYNLSTLNETIKERERIANEDLMSLFIPYLNKNYNWRNYAFSMFSEQDIGKSKLYKNDNYKMLYDQEFENYLQGRTQYNNGNLQQYNRIKQELKNIYLLL
jgi:predicted Zn-dependent protease